MGQHEIDAENLPYHPEKLPKKDYLSVNDYFSLVIRAGKIINVENYPETVSYTHLTLPTIYSV